MMQNEKIINKASAYLGDGGSRFRKFCGLPSGAPWCNAFVCYIFDKCDLASLFYGGKKVTYCPTSIRWCQSNLAQIPPYLAMAGDVIYLDWELNGIPNHIALVRKREDDQKVKTIEGNTNGGVVANRTRTAKYIQGIFRPHYKAEFDKNKPLEIDGQFGYNSIAMLQKALGIKQDGILGKKTVKAMQKKVGVTADGAWGIKTSKAVQKMLKKDGFYSGKIDGCFYEGSVKALQKWINKQNKKKATATQERIDKGMKWLEDQTKKGYHYVNWDGSAKAKECPICHHHSKGGKYYGFNCIGLVSAYLHHGMELDKIKCANNGFLGGNDNYTYLWKKSKKTAQEFVDRKLGKGFKVIKTGKTLTTSDLKKGDIVIYYQGDAFWHIAVYVGDAKIIDSSSSTNGVKKRSWKLAYPCKVAIRYIGK